MQTATEVRARSSFAEAIGDARRLIDNKAQTRLSGDDPLSQAMRYALIGGKALRAFLVLESARLHGAAPEAADAAALAIEAVHAYSLVHDDLPCMDDDDLRRGQPTTHKKFGEDVAVLAGDALQTFAFECLSHPNVGPHATKLIARMAQSAGRQGMVMGQMLDMEAETASTPLSLGQITRLQSQKTGCLISWSATAGPVLVGDDEDALRRYAEALGLAFQIADDILDVEGDVSKVGKRVKKDAIAGKATFVSLLGLEGAKSRAGELVEEACAALDVYGNQAGTLKDAARFVIARES